MSKRQFLIATIIMLMAVSFGMSHFAPASGISETKTEAAASTADPIPAPTPKKRQFPTGTADSAQQPTQPAALKGTIKFNQTGGQMGSLKCEDIEVRVNSGPQTVASVKASGDFLSRRCSFNITGLPAKTPLALLVPTPSWVPDKCSQLQFDNQAIAVPPLTPGKTKPVIIKINFKCNQI